MEQELQQDLFGNIPELKLKANEIAKTIEKENTIILKAKELKDEVGSFLLNGVKVNYIFKNDYFSKEPKPNGCPHIEFRSDEEGKPNDLTETGFRSYFFNGVFDENSVQEHIKSYCEYELKKDKKKCDIKFLNERVVRCKVVESGFDVINVDDFKEDKDIQRLSHSPNKMTNDKIGVTKEQFEEEVKRCYKVDKVEWIEEKIPQIIVKYGLDTEDKRDFMVSCEGCMVSAGSSGFSGKKGEPERTLEEKEKECLKWYIEKILETTEDKVKIIREEMNEEDIKKHNEWKEYHRKEKLKYAEKNIEEYSKKLKEALKVKYGFEVVLKVEKKI